MRIRTPAADRPTSIDLPERPRLGGRVRVHPPIETGQPWFIQRGDSGYFRVSTAVGRIAAEMDGESTVSDIATRLGSPLDITAVTAVAVNLAEKRMLDDGQPVRRRRRLMFVPPLTVQLTLLDPQHLMERLDRLIAVIARSRPRMSVPVLLAVALVVLVVQADSVRQALSQPLPVPIYIGILLGTFGTTVIHEIAHGATLHRFGGRPNRLGVMLLYGSPAFFCDVSDGWRLPYARQRVSVALAGVHSQAVIAAVAALVALPATGWWEAGLLTFSIVTLVAAAVNLLPFVKFDGYLALMSHLDEPHLRTRAIADARVVLARFLFGGQAYRRLLPHRRWAPWFGLAAMVTPLILVGNALSLWSGSLAGFGAGGSVLVAGVVLAAAWFPVRGSSRMLKDARAAGARPVRIAVVSAGLLAGSVVALTQVSVPLTIDGGWAVTDGNVEVFLPAHVDSTLVSPGAHVILQRSGVVLRPVVGSAVIADPPPTTGVAAVSVMSPVDLDGVTVPVTVFPAGQAHDGLTGSGVARIQGPQLPLGRWIGTTYLGLSAG